MKRYRAFASVRGPSVGVFDAVDDQDARTFATAHWGPGTIVDECYRGVATTVDRHRPAPSIDPKPVLPADTVGVSNGLSPAHARDPERDPQPARVGGHEA